ncbi:MAG: hypothetical protein HW421_339 [Ignavibacteria bacterium]|nr:hypothetical protein [Ignavibacteria bacterium]
MENKDYNRFILEAAMFDLTAKSLTLDFLFTELMNNVFNLQIKEHINNEKNNFNDN